MVVSVFCAFPLLIVGEVESNLLSWPAGRARYSNNNIVQLISQTTDEHACNHDTIEISVQYCKNDVSINRNGRSKL